jgi:anti-sigma factor RsiW
MDCRDTKKRLSAYIDNELSLKERQSVERHLGQCPSCAHEERELRIVSILMERIPDDNSSPFFAERVISKVKIGTGEPRMVYRLKPVLAGLLAIVLLIITIAGLSLENTNRPGLYPYLRNFDDFPPGSFSDIYTRDMEGGVR